MGYLVTMNEHKIHSLPITSSLAQRPTSIKSLVRKAAIEQFVPRHAPGSSILLLRKHQSYQVFDLATCESIGIQAGATIRYPDIILWDQKRGWVVMIEAVHSSGAITPARLADLNQICANCPQPAIFVTAFLDRNTFRKFAPDIAWETEVWIADEPDHMIHFNGDRFFGPRKQPHK